MEFQRNDGNENVEAVEPTRPAPQYAPQYAQQQQQYQPQMSLQFDFKKVLKLITNPLESMKLTEKDFLYGIIGLASSYLGFLLWSLFVTKKINAFFNPFYELASLFSERSSRGAAFFAMYSKLMLAGFWSIIALLGVVWLVSWWQGGSKPEIKAFITRLGGIQYIGCAGFLLACIFAASFGLSVIIIATTLLTLLVLTLYAASELYSVAREKLSLYFLASIGGYVLLFSLLTQLLF